MEKMMKSQILKLFLISVLFIIMPLLSTSFRAKYLYFIVNILIIAVGAEAGLASFFLKSPENKKLAQKASEVFPGKEKPITTSNYNNPDHESVKAFKKSSPETEKKTADAVLMVLEKSPSNPSLFFIGGAAEEDCSEEDDVDDDGELSGQELYHKSETFIGDFYNQLKMQRNESVKKLHDI